MKYKATTERYVDVKMERKRIVLDTYHTEIQEKRKQIALHRISYQKKDMVVNAHHFHRLTVKQSFDIENTLLDGDNVIDFPIQPHDLSRYDEVLL